MAEERELARRDYYEENSFVVSQSEPGSLYGFNVEHGFLEAILRGFRSGFLTEVEYRQLAQCETIDDFKLCFQDTDFQEVLSSVDALNDGRLTTDVVVEKCWEKFVQEFMWIRNQASGSLATFLNLIQYEYMIRNVTYLITGLINDTSKDQLLGRCEPMGRFPRMGSILTFENSEDGLLELYRTVLIDTPIGKYFEQYFMASSKAGQENTMEHMRDMISDAQIDIITDTLIRFWLEDFYRYCQKLGGMTGELMSLMLEFRADKQAILTMLNSFETSLNESFNIGTRQQLFCSFGSLYPEAIDAFQRVNDEVGLERVLSKYAFWADCFREAKQHQQEFPGTLMADAVQIELEKREVMLMEMAFEQQSHFGCFYAFSKLKEQEKKNIYWIAECITLNKNERAQDKIRHIFRKKQ